MKFYTHDELLAEKDLDWIPIILDLQTKLEESEAVVGRQGVQIPKLETELADLERARHNLLGEISEARDRIQILEKQISEMERIGKEDGADAAKDKLDLQEANETIERQSDRIAELEEELHENVPPDARLDAMQKTLDFTIEERDKYAAATRRNQDEINKLQVINRELEDKIRSEKPDVIRELDRIVELQKRIGELEAQVDIGEEYAREIGEAQDKIRELQILEEKLGAFEAATGCNLEEAAVAIGNVARLEAELLDAGTRDNLKAELQAEIKSREDVENLAMDRLGKIKELEEKYARSLVITNQQKATISELEQDLQDRNDGIAESLKMPGSPVIHPGDMLGEIDKLRSAVATLRSEKKSLEETLDQYLDEDGELIPVSEISAAGAHAEEMSRQRNEAFDELEEARKLLDGNQAGKIVDTLTKEVSEFQARLRSQEARSDQIIDELQEKGAELLHERDEARSHLARSAEEIEILKNKLQDWRILLNAELQNNIEIDKFVRRRHDELLAGCKSGTFSATTGADHFYKTQGRMIANHEEIGWLTDLRGMLDERPSNPERKDQ